MRDSHFQMLRMVTFSVIISFVAIGCGPSSARRQHEEHAVAVIQCFEDYADDFESVMDQESAKEAAVRINKVNDRMRRLVEQQKQMPKLKKSEADEINSLYSSQFVQVKKRLSQATPTAIDNSHKELTFQQAYLRMVNLARKAKF